MDGRPTWTDCDEDGDYVAPNVLSPRDLVSIPDIMDETVPHTHVSFEFPTTTKTALFSILQSCLIVVTMTQTVKIEWAIKGYHHFRSRPHLDIGLLSSY